MKKIYILLFLYSAISTAQQKPAKLYKTLKESNGDKKVEALLDLSWYHYEKATHRDYPYAFDSASYYVQGAERLSKDIKNNRKLAKAYNLHATVLDAKTKVDNNEIRYHKSLAYIKASESLLKKLNDLPLLGETYYAKYRIQENKVPRIESIQLAEKAKKLVASGDNHILLGYITEDLANYYGHEGDIAKAKKAAEEAVTIYLKYDLKSVYKMYSYLGAIYNETGDYERALEYCLRGIEYSERYPDEDTFQTVDLYNYTGVTFRSLEKYDEALKYFKKAVSIAEKLGNDAALVFYEGNAAQAAVYAKNRHQANVYLKRIEDKSYLADDPNYVNALCILVQSFITLGNEQKTDKYAKLILEKYTAFDDTPDEEWARSSFSATLLNYFFHKKDYSNSRKHALIYKAAAEKNGSKPKIENAYHMLFRIDSAQTDYKSAVTNLRMEKLYHDSIFDEAKSKQLTEMQIKYETQQRIKDNMLLKKTAELQRSKIEKSTILNIVSTCAAIILLLAVILIYRRYRINQKTKRQINSKNIALENLVREKEWLLKEIHHRVKNNLQIVMSLLGTQSHFLKDKGAKEAIKDSQHRIHSMSLIHKKLYQSDNIVTVNIELYFRELIEYYKVAFDTRERIRFEITVDPVELESSQAVPMGLILNEAVNNALKHAFPDSRTGMIYIDVKVKDEIILFTVKDDGIGLELNENIGYNSLGLNLIRGFSKELNAKLDLNGDKGVLVSVTFKINKISD